jgi:hypothetical protein
MTWTRSPRSAPPSRPLVSYRRWRPTVASSPAERPGVVANLRHRAVGRVRRTSRRPCSPAGTRRREPIATPRRRGRDRSSARAAGRGVLPGAARPWVQSVRGATSSSPRGFDGAGVPTGDEPGRGRTAGPHRLWRGLRIFRLNRPQLPHNMCGPPRRFARPGGPWQNPGARPEAAAWVEGTRNTKFYPSHSSPRACENFLARSRPAPP